MTLRTHTRFCLLEENREAEVAGQAGKSGGKEGGTGMEESGRRERGGGGVEK